MPQQWDSPPFTKEVEKCVTYLNKAFVTCITAQAFHSLTIEPLLLISRAPRLKHWRNRQNDFTTDQSTSPASVDEVVDGLTRLLFYRNCMVCLLVGSASQLPGTGVHSRQMQRQRSWAGKIWGGDYTVEAVSPWFKIWMVVGCRVFGCKQTLRQWHIVIALPAVWFLSSRWSM